MACRGVSVDPNDREGKDGQQDLEAQDQGDQGNADQRAAGEGQQTGTDEGKSGAGEGQGQDGRDVNTSDEQRKDEALLAAVKKVVGKKSSDEADGARSQASGDKGDPATDPNGNAQAKAGADGKAKPGKGESKDEGDPSKDDYLSAEEMAALSPRAKKRINTLWREKKEAHERIAVFERDVAPNAEQWGKLNSFLDSNGLSNDEAADLLIIGALLKTDPAKAWEKMKPHVEAIQAFLGQGPLPEDLQKDLDDGTITQERAQELASLRNRQAFDSRRTRETEEQRVEREAQEAHTRTMREVNDATVSRERAVAEKDPDYWTVKAPLMEGEMARLLSARGVPKSKEDAIKLFDEALSNVDTHLKGLRDRFAPRTQRTTKQVLNGRSSATDRAAPASIYDAARLAVERGRAGT